MIRALLAVSLALVASDRPRLDGADPPAVGSGATAARLAQRDALAQKARQLQAAGKLDQAAAAFEQVLAIERELFGPVHEDLAGTYTQLADVEEAADDFPAAERYRKQALEVQLKLHPPDDWRVIDARLALESSRQLASLSPEQRERLRKTIPQIGTVAKLAEQGDYSRAILLVNEVLETRKSIVGEKHRSYAAGLSWLASLYRALGDYPRAEPAYRQTLEISRQILGEKHPDYAANLNNLAGLYDAIGDYAQAEPLYRQALEIKRAVQGEANPSYATSLNNLAGLYKAIADYSRAEPLYRQAAQIFQASLGENHPDYATSLANLAGLYRSTGDFARAEPLAIRALEIRKRAFGEKNLDYATSLNNLAGLYQDMGDLARAEPLFYRALEIQKEILGEKHPDYAAALNNLAVLYHSTGNIQRAEPLLRRVLEINKQLLGDKHPTYARNLSSLAFLYASIGQDARAEPLARAAVQIQLELLDRTAAAQSTRQQLVMLADVRYMLDELLSITARTGDSDLAWQQVLVWKGSVGARQRALHALADRPDLASQWAELQSVTARLARQSRATPSPGNAEAWRAQVAQLSAQVEGLERDLAQKSAAYGQAKQPITLDRLRAALPADAALVDYLEYWHSDPPLPGEPGKSHFERRLVAFVLRRDKAIERFELGPVEPIAAAIDTCGASWGQGHDGAAAAAVLRDKLWATLEPSLAGAKLVLVSPDGALGKLPLAALPGKDFQRYLLEDWPIALLGAPQELVWLKAEPPRRKQIGNMLVLGNVDYDARDTAEPDRKLAKDFDQLADPRRSRAPRGTSDELLFSPLPGTAGELATIEKLYEHTFGAQGLMVLEKAAATTTALRHAAPGYAYLHLATHGFFAPEAVRSALARDLDSYAGGAERSASGQSLAGFHPNLLSGLALAGANQPQADDDGIFTAEDVEKLDLSGARLVVLSACETGLGQSAGGEGLLGLQRAFAAAGARTVVASSWKVDDVVTRDLMERFYANLWDKEMGRLDALREAQLWALSQRGPRGLELEEDAAPRRLPPRYWAAFVLSGDWR